MRAARSKCAGIASPRCAGDSKTPEGTAQPSWLDHLSGASTRPACRCEHRPVHPDVSGPLRAKRRIRGRQSFPEAPYPRDSDFLCAFRCLRPQPVHAEPVTRRVALWYADDGCRAPSAAVFSSARPCPGSHGQRRFGRGRRQSRDLVQHVHHRDEVGHELRVRGPIERDRARNHEPRQRERGRESKRPEEPPTPSRSPPQPMQAPVAELDTSTERDR